MPPVCLLQYPRCWGHSVEVHLSTLSLAVLCSAKTKKQKANKYKCWGWNITCLISWKRKRFHMWKDHSGFFWFFFFKHYLVLGNLIKMQTFPSYQHPIQVAPRGKPMWIIERGFLQPKRQTGGKPHFHILPGTYLCTHTDRSYWHDNSRAFLLVANH